MRTLIARFLGQDDNGKHEPATSVSFGGSITINGETYVGKSVVISNGKVLVDGNEAPTIGKNITINITGNIEMLSCDVADNINVKGNVGGIQSTVADISVDGNVTGDVHSTSGDIEIGGNVTGSVSATIGDIECGNVSGNVRSTSGDVDKRF